MDGKEGQMNMFLLPSVNVPILGVVENMSWFTPAELPDHQYFIFGRGGGERLAEMGETTLLGRIPLVQSIRESGDHDTPGVLSDDSLVSKPFKDLAEKLVMRVAERNASLSPTEVVKME